MDVKILSNQELENTLKKKTSHERQITVEIITLLEEVSHRWLYLQRGFGSLIEYCIKELGYSESSAHRRVSAMRVAKELPQIKVALANGRLNLVNVSRAQTVFQKEAKNQKPLSCVEKSKILLSLENQSARQAEKILLEVSPEPLPKEKIREVSTGHTQVSVVLSEDLMRKLKELRNLLSHKNPNPNYGELIEIMADLALKSLQKTTGPKITWETKKATRSSTMVLAPAATFSAKARCNTYHDGGARRGYISKNLRQTVWQRASGKCQYRDSISQKKCGSQYQLQIEHRQPVAKGGANSEENLELLCAAHNRLRAIEHYGRPHMQKYLGNLNN